MRSLLLASCLLLPGLAAAQQTAVQPPQPKEGSNWAHVQALPAGTTIYVKSAGHTTHCTLASVDADSLACSGHKPLTLQRAAITSVAIPHRGRSTVIFAGVGAGVGAAVVKIVASAAFNGFFNGHAKGAVYAGGAGFGALTFGLIGYGTDATRSTIYNAP